MKKRIKHITDKHKAVFEAGFGLIKDTSAKFYLKDNAAPKFAKARTVPYALRPKVEKELDRLEEAGIISKVRHSDWASPICAVPKPNGDVRICGDFKSTLNPVLKPEHYPFAKVEDVFASLAGGQKFSKIDLTQAYLSVNVHPDHRQYITINTHKGLYQYNRLPYGVVDSGAKFQKSVDPILEGAPGTKCIVDDVIITGKNDDEHLRNLEEVIRRLEEHGLRANIAKCSFLQDEVTFCGHRITKEGLRQTPSKNAAILEAPTPKNAKELLSFIGLIGYYRKFVPNISSILEPLYDLTRKNVKWRWTKEHDTAFARAKSEIASDRVLTHYDPSLPIYLEVDASPTGLGCVMTHELPDNTKRPVIFLSRSLTASEKNYSQIQKEALAVYWGVKKLYHYLYGRHFYLVMDNAPLASIFSPDKHIPECTALRLQRYAIFLSGLNYTVKTRSTTAHANCDGLSRLPLPHTPSDKPDIEHIHNIQQLNAIPISAKDIAHYTRKDKTLSRVYTYVQTGMWSDTTGDFAPYARRKDELSTQQGVIFWRNRVIVPKPLENRLLHDLHSGHPGVVKMKHIARSYLWFPGIDNDIENLVRNCPGCMLHARNPPESELHSWRYPDRPLDRVHIDFAGPIENKHLLVIVDAYSKWADVAILPSTSSDGVIDTLRSFMARLGLIKMIVSDNATCFKSEKFQEFCSRNGIKHVTSAAYHPRSNGAAENMVKQLKHSLKSQSGTQKSLLHRVTKFLFWSRNTENSTTNQKPSSLILRHHPRTRLDLIRPAPLRDTVTEHQAKSKKNANRLRTFEKNDRVLVRNYSKHHPSPWVYGEIMQKTGPVSYRVRDVNNTLHRRHADQIIRGGEAAPPPRQQLDVEDQPAHAANAALDNNVNIPAEINQPAAAQSPPRAALRRSCRAKTARQFPDAIPWDSITNK